MSASIVIGKHELERLIAKVKSASEADMGQLLDDIGQQQEDSARRRILETKRGPDGRRWKPWSKAYARTRGPGQTLLRSTGALADTLTHEVDPSEGAVYVGSNLVYAGRQLRGDGLARGGIPARPYLDTSGGFADSHDRAELRDIVRDFLGGLL